MSDVPASVDNLSIQSSDSSDSYVAPVLCALGSDGQIVDESDLEEDNQSFVQAILESANRTRKSIVDTLTDSRPNQVGKTARRGRRHSSFYDDDEDRFNTPTKSKSFVQSTSSTSSLTKGGVSIVDINQKFYNRLEEIDDKHQRNKRDKKVAQRKVLIVDDDQIPIKESPTDKNQETDVKSKVTPKEVFDSGGSTKKFSDFLTKEEPVREPISLVPKEIIIPKSPKTTAKDTHIKDLVNLTRLSPLKTEDQESVREPITLAPKEIVIPKIKKGSKDATPKTKENPELTRTSLLKKEQESVREPVSLAPKEIVIPKVQKGPKDTTPKTKEVVDLAQMPLLKKEQESVREPVSLAPKEIIIPKPLAKQQSSKIAPKESSDGVYSPGFSDKFPVKEPINLADKDSTNPKLFIKQPINVASKKSSQGKAIAYRSDRQGDPKEGIVSKPSKESGLGKKVAHLPDGPTIKKDTLEKNQKPIKDASSKLSNSSFTSKNILQEKKQDATKGQLKIDKQAIPIQKKSPLDEEKLNKNRKNVKSTSVNVKRNKSETVVGVNVLQHDNDGVNVNVKNTVKDNIVEENEEPLAESTTIEESEKIGKSQLNDDNSEKIARVQVDFNASILESKDINYLSHLPVVPDEDPQPYVPILYTFRVKPKDNRKLEHLTTQSPPFYVLLDHTIAVIWTLFNSSANKEGLGIVQLQWALYFLQQIHNVDGVPPKDVNLCIETIQEYLIDQYSDMSEESVMYGNSTLGEYLPEEEKILPFSLNYSQMIEKSVLIEEEEPVKVFDKEILDEIENVKKLVGIESIDLTTALSRDKTVLLISDWKREQIEKIQEELKLLRLVDDMMKNFDDNFESTNEEELTVIFSGNKKS